MGMKLTGFDLHDIDELTEMLRMLDADCYVNLLLSSLPNKDATHYTDIRVVSLDEKTDEIHLSNRLGWMIESGIGEEWASLDRIYEAKVSLKKLVDTTVPSNERVRMVQWREAEVQRVAKENEISQDGQSSISRITTTWNRVGKPIDEVIAEVDRINSARRESATSPYRTKPSHIEKCNGCDDADVERLIRHLNKDM